MSDLHRNSKVNVMASGAKIPVSAMSGIEPHTGASNLRILVDVNNMYEENLSDSEECFVLVDDRDVRVMSGGSTVQQLLSSQGASIGAASDKTVQVLQMDGNKALDIMGDRNKETIEVVQMNDGRTVEVLPLEDDKTVEVVQMDGDKTLEVMHVDTVKHSEVIHVDGSSSIELLSVGTSLSGPTLTSGSPTVYQKSKEKYILSTHGSDSTSPCLAVKRALTSENIPSSVALSLSSLAPVNSSFVLTSPKNSLLSGHQFTHMSTVTTLATSRQSQVMENDLETLTQVTPSIVVSGNKKGISNDADSLNNTIIISWPPMSPKLDNSVQTQTEPYMAGGPSLNLFLCTFHRDGSVETQCDMPVQRDVSVSTHSSGRCTAKVTSSHVARGGNSAVKLGETSADSGYADSRFSKSGQSIKLEDSFYKSSGDPLSTNEEFDLNLPGNEDQDCSDNNNEEATVYRKKRGRKKKRRYPSTDDYDYDLDFDSPCNEESDTVKVDVKAEVTIKDEPSDKDEEMAINVLKTKGYGLRTKRRLKKLSDMHYMEEKVVKKKIERTQHFSCQWCPDVFPTFTRLQRHAKEEHDSTDFAFPCEVCGVVFTRPHNLERHKDTKHGDGEKRFVCDHCGRRFGRQDVLSVHISMVHFKKSLQGKSAVAVFGSKTFHCTGCDQFFSKEQKLKNHRQDQSCSDCNLSFECKASLRSHQYKHHPTSCSECGKLCDSKQQMYLHRLSHDPKYVCNICHKGFLWKSQFAVHMSTHTGEKPVLCDICGKSFAHKLAVNKHKWQEHDESNKKFKCMTCGKRFVYKGKLQSHMRSHTGEKPFMCHLCSASFSQRCNLTAHIRSVHGVYIQSIKSDGTTQTQLVKYKRAKKQSPLDTQPAVFKTMMTHSVETPVPEQPQIAVQEEVQMSESFETAAAVYQIVYAYQQ